MKTEVRKCVKAFRRTLELAAGEHKEQWNGMARWRTDVRAFPDGL
ncbi:hypothetical protein [Serratia fonticola]|jgi:hypothetical protein|nr:hypothetical protein [Serratia fonticola]